MIVKPVLQHWKEGGKITRDGTRIVFVPFRSLMDIPEKEK